MLPGVQCLVVIVARFRWYICVWLCFSGLKPAWPGFSPEKVAELYQTGFLVAVAMHKAPPTSASKTASHFGSGGKMCFPTIIMNYFLF